MGKNWKTFRLAKRENCDDIVRPTSVFNST